MARLAVFVILFGVLCSGAFGKRSKNRVSTCQVASEIKPTEYLTRYEAYLKKYKKNYSTEEIIRRLPIYIQKLHEIEELNAAEPNAEFGENYLTDWEFEELANLTLNKDDLKDLQDVDCAILKNREAPEKIDWREKGAVTPIKDQKLCGSCWAFATVAHIENVYAIKHGAQQNFSEQQLVDCDTKSVGCNGGFPHWALESIKEKGGLDTAESYPYEAQDGECRFKPANVGTKVKDYKKIPAGKEDLITTYVGTTSTTINGIEASTFFSYKGGIIDGTKCDPTTQNHAVVIVGYTPDYWIVKNSWGPNWGENGYFRIKKGINACGIAEYVVGATLE